MQSQSVGNVNNLIYVCLQVVFHFRLGTCQLSQLISTFFPKTFVQIILCTFSAVAQNISLYFVEFPIANDGI